MRAADGDDRGMEERAVQEDAQVGELLADVHHHRAVLASSRLSMASALASGEYISSDPCRPAAAGRRWMFSITGPGATMMRTSASSVSPNMLTGLRMSRWPLMWNICGMRWRTSLFLGQLAAVGGLLQHPVPVRRR